MKILNAEIQGFLLFIMNEELTGKMSRMRSRFRKMCADRLKLIEEEKQSLIDLYSKKDEHNKPIIQRIGEREQYEIEDMDYYSREYKALMLEEWSIDMSEERKDFLLAIKDIVENTSQKLSNELAMQYERYCEIVEQIQY